MIVNRHYRHPHHHQSSSSIIMQIVRKKCLPYLVVKI